MKKGRKRFQNDKAIGPDGNLGQNMIRATWGTYVDHPLFKCILNYGSFPENASWNPPLSRKAENVLAEWGKQNRDKFCELVGKAILKMDSKFFEDVAMILKSIAQSKISYASPRLDALGMAYFQLSIGKPKPTREQVVALARKRYPALTNDMVQIYKDFKKLGLTFAPSTKRRGPGRK